MKAFAILAALTLWCGIAWSQISPSASKPILSGPLVKLDIKDAKVEPARGKPKGTLNIGLHFGLDPGWLDPLGYHGAALQFLYVVHDALIKPMPQGEFQRIDPRPGGAKALIRLYAVCGGEASYICEPKIDALWTKHEASVDPAERDRLSKEMQRLLVGDTVNAPFPWPWEVWEVKG